MPMPTEINPAAPAMSDAEAEATARRIITDFATSYRDPTPSPPIGTAPPVAQPGRPPMSRRATDASALILAAGVASLPIGGSVSLVLYALGQVDPVVLGIAAGAPAVLALALGQLVKRITQTAPPEVHHHYSGPVQQTNQAVTNTNKLWGKSSTNL
ncbi:hypothetical protein [Streptomyces flavidovirens]